MASRSSGKQARRQVLTVRRGEEESHNGNFAPDRDVRFFSGSSGWAVTQVSKKWAGEMQRWVLGSAERHVPIVEARHFG